MSRLLAVAVVALACGACGQSPTAPTASPVGSHYRERIVELCPAASSPNCEELLERASSVLGQSGQCIGPSSARRSGNTDSGGTTAPKISVQVLHITSSLVSQLLLPSQSLKREGATDTVDESE
jgi:hypothetical protein